MSTKIKILEKAVIMFSERGYAAVSIRDICKEVGIKESTIYYHFENKQDILTQIIARFQQLSEEMPQQLMVKMMDNKFLTIGKAEFICILKAMMREYYMNEYINACIRILMIEQQNDEKLANLYHAWLFDKPIQIQEEFMKQLIQQKCLKNISSKKLALAFYTPIFFLFHRYLVDGNIDEKIKRKMDNALEEHIDFFWEQYGENEND